MEVGEFQGRGGGESLHLSLHFGALEQLDEGLDGVAVADEKAACDLARDVLECARSGAAHAWLGVVEEAHQPSDAALPPNHTYGVHIGAYVVQRPNRPRPDLQRTPPESSLIQSNKTRICKSRISEAITNTNDEAFGRRCTLREPAARRSTKGGMAPRLRTTLRPSGWKQMLCSAPAAFA